jgi:hypothetical protein
MARRSDLNYEASGILFKRTPWRGFSLHSDALPDAFVQLHFSLMGNLDNYGEPLPSGEARPTALTPYD